MKNIFFFQTITHGKLTTGSYFRGGGCRATDSSCSPVNELSLSSCCSTSTSVWVLASGGALLPRPPRLAWPTMRGLVLNWMKVGVLKGPTGFQTSPNLLSMAAFANLGSGWRSQKKSYMNNKLTGSFSLPAQEWRPALRPHSSAWPRDRECTSPCTLSSSCNSRKVLITKMCHSLNKVFLL